LISFRPSKLEGTCPRPSLMKKVVKTFQTEVLRRTQTILRVLKSQGFSERVEKIFASTTFQYNQSHHINL